jgi:quinol monooxygenase YgiN
VHIAISQYRVKLGHADRTLRLIEQHLVPLVRNVRGFVSFQVVTTGSQAFTSIGVFASKDAVETGNELVKRWLLGQPPDLVEGSPKVATGALRISATADRALDAAALHPHDDGAQVAV